MIFRRSLVRELTATAIGLFLVLLAILFTNLVLRLLARAAGGAIAPDGILALLGFNALFYLNILLSVALFLTVLLTLSRWYRDSEMIVWFTSGQSLTACLTPIMLFAAPFLLAIVALSLYLSPWAEQRKIEFERQLESRDDLAVVTPGLFREFSRANLVVFVESINPFDNTVRNVFLHSVEDKQEATTVAARGKLEDMPNGDRFIVLEHGRRYQGTPGAADYRVVEFEKLGRRIEPSEVRALPTSTKAIPSAVLLASNDRVERAELFWRISVPISRYRADDPRRAARVRQSANGTLVQPGRRGIPVHALQQLPQHRAEPDRAGPPAIVGGPAVAARDRIAGRHRALPAPIVGDRPVCAPNARHGGSTRLTAMRDRPDPLQREAHRR